mmetsp:Transcript_7544/g.8238  ORF Transcript_7544/g.8238 Transcript_7544/m.8238 type:complete len:101 (+) Transcript_7544:98-400(+)
MRRLAHISFRQLKMARRTMQPDQYLLIQNILSLGGSRPGIFRGEMTGVTVFHVTGNIYEPGPTLTTSLIFHDSVKPGSGGTSNMLVTQDTGLRIELLGRT